MRKWTKWKQNNNAPFYYLNTGSPGQKGELINSFVTGINTLKIQILGKSPSLPTASVHALQEMKVYLLQKKDILLEWHHAFNQGNSN